jgi:type II secretory pathway component HofQ
MPDLGSALNSASLTNSASFTSDASTRTFLHQTSASDEPRITATYEDADIHNVIAAFAAFSGRTIVVARGVQGTVTVEVHDLPWDVALQSILTQQQLVASEGQDGIITVSRGA